MYEIKIVAVIKESAIDFWNVFIIISIKKLSCFA